MSYGSAYGGGPGRRPNGFDPGERTALFLVVVASGFFGWYWLSLGLGSVLSAGGWPESLGLIEVGKGFVQWPLNLSDPAAVWPRRARDDLAGGFAFYFVGAILAALVITALLAYSRDGSSRGSGLFSRLRSGRDEPPTANWASRSEVADLLVDGRAPNRLILGRWPNRGGRGPQLLATEPLQSVLVIAPPRAGKTTGLAIPAVLEHAGPVIATSIRADILDATLASRERLGEVMVFDPTASTGAAATPWTPLGHSRSWEGSQRMAYWLCSTARDRGGGGMQDGDFWFKAAAKMLAPHLLAASRAGADMETLLRWVETQEQAEVVAILERFDEHQALQALSATFSREDRQRSSIYTTVETVLEAYTDPRVIENSRSCDISPARLFDGGSHTLYLCGPANEQERLAPLFGALLEEIAAVAYRSNLELGKPLDPPLLIVGDELANIAPIRSLPQIASTGAGSGIQLISIFQDLAQLQERWGKSWRTIANSHRARLFGTGNGDPETLDYVRKLTGEAAYEQHSDTRGEMGNRSRTDSATYRSIAPANVVREADPGTALLVYGHLPPTTIELRPFFEDPGLRALAGLGADAPKQSPFKRPRRSRAGTRSGRR